MRKAWLVTTGVALLVILAHIKLKVPKAPSSIPAGGGHSGTRAYIINSATHICAGAGDDDRVDAVMYILSAPAHFERRSMIRCTWGNTSRYTGSHIALFFILGMTPKPAVQLKIEAEAAAHRDIVQGSFQDSYRNLTYKDVACFQWILTFCSEVKFVIKLDDDVFVALRHVLPFLQDARDNEIRCLSMWPNRCSGPAYVLPIALIQPFLNASELEPYYWAEDVYVTKLLRLRLGVGIAPFTTNATIQRAFHADRPLEERLALSPFVLTQRNTSTWPTCEEASMPEQAAALDRVLM